MPSPQPAAQTQLADFCLWWPSGRPGPCYAYAHTVVVRPVVSEHVGAWFDGQTLGFTCAEHAPLWAGEVQGAFHLLSREDWEAAGWGYRGPHLGA